MEIILIIVYTVYLADMTSMGIISHLLGSTLRSKIVNNIIAALNR